MATNINTILGWFTTGKKPTQGQFWASWQSFWHKDEQIPQSSITNLISTLNAKTEKSQFEAHKTDQIAHTELFVTKENKSSKGVAGGYAPLDSFTKLAAQYLNIVNDLTTGGATELLSAEQGKNLKGQIDAINTLLASDNVNLDTVQEIVDAIETMQTSLGSILVNDLTTGGTTKALTAEMGKNLKSQIDAINTLLASDNVNLDTVQELVDAIETMQASLSTILVNDLATGGTTKALTAEMGKTIGNRLDLLEESSVELSVPKTKAEIDALIVSNGLIVGTTYKISGVHPTLFSDGTLSNTNTKFYSRFGDYNSGSGYVDGWYENIPAIGGNGSGVLIHVSIKGGVIDYVTSIKGISPMNYLVGDVITIDNALLGGSGSGFSYTVKESDIEYLGVGSTIYLEALTTNTLAKSGHGEFWTPKYKKNVDGFGIWSANNYWDITPTGTEVYKSAIFGSINGNPQGIAIDSVGNIYTANITNNISKITPQGVSTIYGTTGNSPYSIVFDSDNNLYVANFFSDNVSKITPEGVSTIFATVGTRPISICIDSVGNIYTSNYDSMNVSKITPSGVSTILGTTGTYPQGIMVDSFDNIYTANVGSNNISKITPSGESTIFCSGLNSPTSMVIDSNGDFYVTNYSSDNVSKIPPSGIPTIFSTTGRMPNSISFDSLGNLYTANYGSNNVSKITSDGISTIIGSAGTSPQALCVDSVDNIYVANANSSNVSKISFENVMLEFQRSESIIADNGAFGSLAGSSDSGVFIFGGESADWSTATSIVGINSGAKANVSNIILRPDFQIGDKTIYGGYSWTNSNGQVGNYNDLLNLDSDNWIKDKYDEVNYIKVYDPIEYDYVNDWISRRTEIESGNDVNYTFVDYNTEGWDYSAISVFMFGNKYIYTNRKKNGIGNIVVNHAYNENINFIGSFQKNMVFDCGSYQSDNVFDHNSSQENITFGYNSSQENITFGYSSSQNSITLGNNSSQYSITFSANAKQNSITFGDNSSQTNTIIKYNQVNTEFEQNSRISNLIGDEIIFSINNSKIIFTIPHNVPKVRYYNSSCILVIRDVSDIIESN